MRNKLVLLLFLVCASCAGGNTSPGLSEDTLRGDARDGAALHDGMPTDIIHDKGFADSPKDQTSPGDAPSAETSDALPGDGGTLKDGVTPETGPDLGPSETVDEPGCQKTCGELGCGMDDGCGGICQCPNGYGCPPEAPFVCKPDCALLCAGRLCGTVGVLGECYCGPCEDNNPCTENVCLESGNCTYPNAAVPCNDNDPCTGGDRCTGGECRGTLLDLAGLKEAKCLCAVNEDCLRFEDGNACNGSLTCQDAGGGVKVCGLDLGTVPDCDDGNLCTKDSCLAASGCVLDSLDVACDDHNPCTVGDWCRDGQCASGKDAKDCDDGEPCTDDLCDPLTPGGCVNPVNSGECEDGNPCTEGDSCLNGVCVGGVHEKQCDDGNPCTDDSCDPNVAGGCRYVFNTKPCVDEDPCTLGEVCKEGECLGNGKLSCADGNVCTEDFCVAGVGCQSKPAAGNCEDGDTCTKGDTCQDGVCVPGPNDCVCVLDDDCLRFNDANWCNGFYWCTWKKTPNVCEIRPNSVIKCPAPPVPVCTANLCDPKDGICKLAVVNEGQPCEDNNPCTTGDFCGGGSCKPGFGVQDCDDHNPCTDDSCDPKVAGGCVHANNTRPCDDGNPCSLLDFCYESRCIAGGTAKNCDDKNICTRDYCDPLVTEGCVHEPMAGTCDDGDPCTLSDYCSEGACRSGKQIKDCNDNNVCTKETCVAWKGCEYVHAPGTCSDGNLCTYGDTCLNKVCTGTAYKCDKPGKCETATGAACKGDGTCNYPVTTNAVCDDGNLCTHTDRCQANKACLGTAYSCTKPGVCETATGATCKGDNTCNYPVTTGAVCNDNNSCTHTDKCQANKACTGIGYSCDDNNVCTADTCLGNGTCQHVMVPANCASIGCSDGTKDAFKDLPKIAGCAGDWKSPSLRQAASGTVNCGGASLPCPSPADLCAPGWHVCMKDGLPAELRDRVSADQCKNNTEGMYLAASSHCSDANGCKYGGLSCLNSGLCSEPLCCGKACNPPGCANAVWDNNRTLVFGGTEHGCGNSASVTFTAITGILCCKD